MANTKLIDLAPPAEKAFLVAVDVGDDGGWSAEESLAELANLATTAGADVVGAEWQNRRHVDPNWYVGRATSCGMSTSVRSGPCGPCCSVAPVGTITI
jgi:50S ribosomal subunit-associated GTPase HflX